MAGSILGKDQIAKVNASYFLIYGHIKTLVEKSATPYELMNIHFLLDHHDTTELFNIFKDLSFLSPSEKNALVRAAIFDVLLKREPVQVDARQTDAAGVTRVAGAVPLTVYSPPQFKLNVTTTGATQVVVPPTPPTEAHTPIVQPQVQETAVQGIVTHSGDAHTLNITTVEDHQGK